MLTSLFSTVPSVAPSNVSGGNGRRHELVISWEVGFLSNSLKFDNVQKTVLKANPLN